MRTNYARRTFIEHANNGFGGIISGAALCSDGRTRKLKRVSAYADTWFSVPAAVTVRGKTVTGYISVETVEGFSTPTDNDPAVVKFNAYLYRKNHAVLPPGTYKETPQ